MNATLWTINPLMKCTSRGRRSSLLTMTALGLLGRLQLLLDACFPAVGRANARRRRHFRARQKLATPLGGVRPADALKGLAGQYRQHCSAMTHR
jgi:hypothetical protein